MTKSMLILSLLCIAACAHHQHRDFVARMNEQGCKLVSEDEGTEMHNYELGWTKTMPKSCYVCADGAQHCG